MGKRSRRRGDGASSRADAREYARPRRRTLLDAARLDDARVTRRKYALASCTTRRGAARDDVVAARGRVPLRAPRRRAGPSTSVPTEGQKELLRATAIATRRRAPRGSATCCASTSPSTSPTSRRRERPAPRAPPARLRPEPGPASACSQALAQPTIGHMDPAFAEVMDRDRRAAARAFVTENHATLSGLGHRQRRDGGARRELRRPRATASSAASTACSASAWPTSSRRAGAEVVRVEAEWGRAIPTERLDRRRARGAGRDGRRARRDVHRRRAAARRPGRRLPRARRAAAGRLRHLADRPPAAPGRGRRRRRVRGHAEVPELPARPGAVHRRRAGAGQARAPRAARTLVVLRPLARARLLESRPPEERRARLPPHRADQPHLRAARGAAHRDRRRMADQPLGAPPPRARRAARGARRSRLPPPRARRRAAAPAAGGHAARRRGRGCDPRGAADRARHRDRRRPRAVGRPRCGGSASWAPARSASRRHAWSARWPSELGVDGTDAACRAATRAGARDPGPCALRRPARRLLPGGRSRARRCSSAPRRWPRRCCSSCQRAILERDAWPLLRVELPGASRRLPAARARPPPRRLPRGRLRGGAQGPRQPRASRRRRTPGRWPASTPSGWPAPRVPAGRCASRR